MESSGFNLKELSKSEKLGFFLLFLLAFLLRIFCLDKQVIWTDEAWTIWAAEAPLKQIFELCRNSDFHPPLYYLFLHFWLKIWGTSALWVRIPSLCFDLTCLFMLFKLAYLIGEKEQGKKLAWGAAILYAFSGFLVIAAQEARMYSLLNLLLLLSAFYFYRALKQNQPKDWLLYSLFITLSLYTHYISFHILTGFSLVFFLLFVAGKLPRRCLLFFSLSLFGVFLFYLPWAEVLLLRFLARNSWAGITNIPDFKINFLFTLFVLETGWANPYHYTAGKMELLLALPALIGVFSLRKRILPLLFLFFYSLYPLLISMVLFMITQRQTFNPYHLMVAAAGFYLLSALGGISLLEKKFLRVLAYPLLFAFLLLNLTSLYNWYFNPFFQRENWKSITRLIEKWEKPGDAIVVETAHRGFPFKYNFKGKSPVIPVDNLAKLPSNLLVGRNRIWLVESCSDVSDPNFTVRKFLLSTGKTILALREDNFHSVGVIELRLFQLGEQEKE